MATIIYKVAFATIATALTAAAGTYLLIWLSLRLRLMAEARVDRWHIIPTPNTGGIAIALSCVAAGVFLVSGATYRLILGTGVALAAFGAIDDRVQMRPLTKLAGQMAACALIISHGLIFRPTHLDAINLGVTFLWIIGITNAFNLIDNMDGLCAGVTIIIASFRLVAAIQAGDSDAAVTLAIVAGAFLGFLLFNHNPARIFMGDGGSLFAGFVLSAVTISGPVPHTRLFLSGLLYPALTFLYPIFDTTLVSVLRRLAGRPASTGGRDHSSHRLVALGLSERKAVWLLWGLAALGSATGLLSSWIPSGIVGVGVLLLLAATLFGIFLGSVPAFEIPPTAPVRALRIRKLAPSLRATVTMFVDALLAGIALYCAFLLRWESSLQGLPMRQLTYSLPIVCVSHSLASVAFGSIRCRWRWFGLSDLLLQLKSVVCGCVLFVLVLWVFGIRDYSRGVVLLYAILAMCFVSGARLFMRALFDLFVNRPSQERAAILGAGDAGELAILICQRRGVNAIPVVVLESDPAQNNVTVRGVPVRSVTNDAIKVLNSVRATTVIIPSGVELCQAEHEIVVQCERAGMQVVRLQLAITPKDHEQTASGLSALVNAVSESVYVGQLTAEP